MSTQDDVDVPAEELVRTTFESMRDAIFVVALPEREIAACNAAASEMFDIPRDELIGSNTRRLHVDDESWERFHEESVGPLEEQGYFRGEFSMRRADGTVFPTEHVVTFVQRDEEGDARYAVSGVRDISARKRTEELLRKSEEKFSTAFQMNPLALAILSRREGRFVDVNDAFCARTGYERAELLDRALDEFDLWGREADRETVRERLSSGEGVRKLGTNLRRKDGEIRNVLLSIQEIEVEEQECLLAAMRDVTERKEFREQLQTQALRDGLTGLPNRTLFRNRLSHALDRAETSGDTVAVAFLDVVRFRVVNKTLGHAAGDEYLKTIARRVTDQLADHVTVARLGADEFALLFEELRGVGRAEQRCRDLLEVLTEPFEVADTLVHPELGVGIAATVAGEGKPSDLLRHADIALARAKKQGESAISRYDPDRDTKPGRRLYRENALHRAVDKRQFVLRYQPVVDLPTGEAVGAEALVRWDHPEHGIITPGEFLGLAEETGLIVPIGHQVLEQAMDRGAEWPRTVPVREGEVPFRLGVNLSPTQYRDPDVVDRIRQTAETAEFDVDRLVLEITENILVTGDGKLAALREEGVRIAIDDFGTGYASLQYLRRLDAEILKIDRSFVRGLGEETRERILVDAILDVGERCDLQVVVEGIETERQRRILIELGARYGQGYHFARPMTGEEFTAEWIPSRQ